MTHAKDKWMIAEENPRQGPHWGPLDSTNSIAICEPHGHLVARVCSTGISSPADPNGKLAAKANAELILAAPAMLLALRTCIKATAAHVGPGHIEAYNAVRDAIELATGQRPPALDEPDAEAWASLTGNVLAILAERDALKALNAELVAALQDCAHEAYMAQFETRWAGQSP